MLQALAGARLLTKFDYLSTVSGGGYIGSWLQSLIHVAPDRDPAAVEAALAASEPASSAIAALRNYTRYLSPEAGLFSRDLWTDVVLWLRNTLLTWVVYMPLLALAVTLAILYRTVIWASAGPAQPVLIALAALALAISTFDAARFLPDHRPRRSGRADYATPGQITLYAYAPALVWAFLGPMTQGDNPQGVTVWPDWASHLVPWFAEDARSTYLLVVAYFIALSLGYAAATFAHDRDRGGELFRLNALAWLAASVVSAGIIYCGAALAHAIPASDQAQALAVFGPLWLLGAAGIHTAIYVGFRRDGGLLDLDREWFARLSALRLRAGALWAVFACACLVLSWWAMNHPGTPAMAGLAGSLAAGPVSAWLGKQTISQVETLLTRKGTAQLPFNLLLNVLAGVFLIAVIALLGFVIDTYLLGSIMQEAIADHWIRGCQPPASAITRGLAERFNPPTELIQPYCEESLLQPFAAVLVLFLALLVVAWLIGRFVNVNRYTMHAVYRNRLTRAFLGSARAKDRHAEPFSEFDPGDNVPLAGLERGPPQKLFPVINMTLNQTYGGAAAWSDRKALAFTATPLACGAPNLGGADEQASLGAYVPTRLYAGRESPADAGENRGLTLATAMAISGAAVSPNWGYHSSPLTAFIMTLFNVRLGAWLPNPAANLPPEKLALAMPPDRLRSLLGDLLGMSRASDPAVYLSDGGHFDNLGLYEMLRRRCRWIAVIDAGEDGSCTYQDLGSALRKAAIDMGITVQFRAPWRIAARSAGEQERQEALGFLIGKIKYPEARQGQACRLLYLKPSLLADVPADVRAYANVSPQFPHEPTWDQWFTEAQFESYRKLGDFQMGRLLARRWLRADGIGLTALFSAAARAYAGLEGTGQADLTIRLAGPAGRDRGCQPSGWRDGQAAWSPGWTRSGAVRWPAR